jgi:hypothetical protein
MLYYLGGGVLGGFVNVLFAVIIPGATSAYLLIGFWFHGDGDHEWTVERLEDTEYSVLRMLIISEAWLTWHLRLLPF